MKNIKKVMPLVVGVMVSALTFTGCSNNGTSLYNAINKTQAMNASEVQSDITLNISATNMASEESKTMGMIMAAINASKLSVVTDTYQNNDKTIAKAKGDIKITGPTTLDMGVWVNTDITKDKPVIGGVFKMPDILTSQLPSGFKGKNYMTMNYDDMNSAEGKSQVDLKKLIQFSKEFQPKLLKFSADYVKQYNTKLNIINKTDTKSINTSTGLQLVDIYELKLDDKTFKDLMHYTLTNFGDNKDAIAFLKDYMINVTSLEGLTDKEKNDAIAEINKTFADMPQTVTQLDKELDTLKNINIIGSKGIKIQYAVNRAGYIVNKTGSAEFIINLPELTKLSEDNSTLTKDVKQDSSSVSTGTNGIIGGADGSTAIDASNASTGIYTVNLSFNTNYSVLDEKGTITFPTLTKDNSFNYADLLKAESNQSSTNTLK